MVAGRTSRAPLRAAPRRAAPRRVAPPTLIPPPPPLCRGSWLGQSAIAAWGKSDGPDGTSGEQPRGLLVEANVARELGVLQKQSAFFVSAVACQNTVRGNVVFNVPRAALCFLDRFGGGDDVEGNLLFNTCRESGDHGAINYWSRQPYVTLVRDGATPSAIPAFSEIRSNLIVSNYEATAGCVDTDDGSSWLRVALNFCVYGGHKSAFDGHAKLTVGNLLLYPQIYGPGCVNVMAQHLPPPGFGDAFVNNTCILSDAGQDAVSLYPDALPPPAEFAARLALAGNAFIAPNASTRFQGPGDSVAYQAFQAQGYDTSSVVSGDVPDAPTVISWARALLLGGEQGAPPL